MQRALREPKEAARVSIPQSLQQESFPFSRQPSGILDKRTRLQQDGVEGKIRGEPRVSDPQQKWVPGRGMQELAPPASWLA